MDTIFSGKDKSFVLPYMDDIIIFSQTKEEHIEHLNYVFMKLLANNIYLNKKKCKFLETEVKMLGNIVSHKKVKPNPEKVNAIKNYKKPDTIKELRAFLGLANQMRHFIKNFADIINALNSMLEGQSKRSVKKIKWTKDSLEAFEVTKRIITDITFRSQPDFTKKFILTTDASNAAIGAILSQELIEGEEQVIYFYSRKMSKAEQNYSVTDKELLAVVKGINHFRHYLNGKEFVLKTDHKALECLNKSTELSSRLMRWALHLQEYKFKLTYIEGDKNAADGLSRYIKTLRLEDLKLNELDKLKILQSYHISSGHGSYENMKFLLADKITWENQSKEIKKLIDTCEVCQKAERKKTNTKNLILDIRERNKLWLLDLVGPIKSKEGKKNLFWLA